MCVWQAVLGSQLRCSARRRGFVVDGRLGIDQPGVRERVVECSVRSGLGLFTGRPAMPANGGHQAFVSWSLIGRLATLHRACSTQRIGR